MTDYLAEDATDEATEYEDGPDATDDAAAHAMDRRVPVAAASVLTSSAAFTPTSSPPSVSASKATADSQAYEEVRVFTEPSTPEQPPSSSRSAPVVAASVEPDDRGLRRLRGFAARVARTTWRLAVTAIVCAAMLGGSAYVARPYLPTWLVQPVDSWLKSLPVIIDLRARLAPQDRMR
jgi:hypothetical protein